MSKKIKNIIKLQIEAGKATPAPPVGPALAQYGLNLSDFCQKFNDKTKDNPGWKIPVEIIIYEDKTFDLETKQPLASQLLKKAAGIEKGSSEPNKRKVAKLSKEKIKEVAERKMKDLSASDIESAIKIIEGTAKSMGIEVEK